jgi:hypothetical protein
MSIIFCRFTKNKVMNIELAKKSLIGKVIKVDGYSGNYEIKLDDILQSKNALRVVYVIQPGHKYGGNLREVLTHYLNMFGIKTFVLHRKS